MDWQAKQEETSRYQPLEKVNFPRPAKYNRGEKWKERMERLEKDKEKEKEAKEGAQTE